MKTTSQLDEKLWESDILTFSNEFDIWEFKLDDNGDNISMMKNARVIKIAKNTHKTLEFILDKIKTHKLELDN